MRAFSVLFFLMGLLLVVTAGPISLDRTYTYPEVVEWLLGNHLPGENEEIGKQFAFLCLGDSCVIKGIMRNPAPETNEAHNSVEDYVQGCGPRDENSYEANETVYKDDISKRSAEPDSQSDEESETVEPIYVVEYDYEEVYSNDANIGTAIIRERRQAKESNESNSPESDESKEKKIIPAVIEAAASAPEGEKTQEANEPAAAAAEEEAPTTA